MNDARREAMAARVSRWLARLATGAVAIFAVALLAATIGPKIAPFQTYIVLTGSMEPALPVGSLIVLTQVAADEVRVGDVITVTTPDRPGDPLTHRVVAIETTDGGGVFVTRGDANQLDDGWRVPAVGTGWRYAFGLPWIGYLLGIVRSQFGRMLLFLVPSAALGVWLLVELWRPRPARVAV